MLESWLSLEIDRGRMADTKRVLCWGPAHDEANAALNPKGGNSMTTARYNCYNFVPLFLFEQFHPWNKFGTVPAHPPALNV